MEAETTFVAEGTVISDLDAEVEVSHLPGKSFQYFRDHGILEEVGRLCQLVGRHGDLVATVDLCLHLLHHTSHTRKETLLLVTLVLQHGDYICTLLYCHVDLHWYTYSPS